MTDGDCVGSCNGRERRAQGEYKLRLAAWDEVMAHRQEGEPEPSRPVPPDIRPWPGAPIFCLRCQSILRTQLAELDDLAAHLAAVPDLRAPADAGARVSGTRGTPSPSPAMDDLDELAGWLRDWQTVAQGSEPLARRGYLATAITTTVAWLTLHFDPMIVNPDIAEDFGNEILRWHRSLTAKTKTGAGLKHQKRPCPRCNMFTLWRSDGDRYVRCVSQDCQRVLSLDEYDALGTGAVA